MTEAQLLDAVRRMAGYLGWMRYHTRDSRGSEPGFPDLVLCSSKQRRVLFVELKSATGKTTPAQAAWLAALAAAGAETALWRPADLADVIPAVLRGRRLTPEEASADVQKWPEGKNAVTTNRDSSDRDRKE
jgi:hypothetical protein